MMEVPSACTIASWVRAQWETRNHGRRDILMPGNLNIEQQNQKEIMCTATDERINSCFVVLYSAT